MFTARGEGLDAMLNQARNIAQTQRAAAEEDGLGPFSIQAAGANFPDFNTAEPDIWFNQLEIFFRFAKIRKDGDQLYNVLHRLPREVFNRIAVDLSDNLPEEDQYGWLKKLLCRIYGKSDTRKAELLLNLRQLGSSHPNALLNEVRGLIPNSHKEHQCSQCGHKDTLPPCPIAYMQFRSRLPPAVRREMPPAPKTWGEVARDVDESWEAHTSLAGPARVNAVETNDCLTTNPPIQPNYWQAGPSSAPTTAQQVTFAQPPVTPWPSETMTVAAAQARLSQAPVHINPTPLICQYHLVHGDRAISCQVGCAYQAGVQPKPQNSKPKSKPKNRVGSHGRKKHYSEN